MNRSLWFCASLLVGCSLMAMNVSAQSLIGKAAKPWQVEHWMNSKPLTLADLKGKVVLVRWWTAPGCPYCAATAPSLNEFRERYRDRGLVVIGMYHHKSDRPLEVAEVKKHVQRFGFQFPVAIDPDWQTLKKWWLDIDNGHTKWTSVSFLIDRQGRIRHIHEGGEYPPGSKDYATMQAQIEEALRE